jgi:DtxR family transcriptional regulator, Mn-dependent transcriptional regulator
VPALNAAPVSSAVEDYAKAIWGLQQDGDAPVTTNALAESLGVTPGSASAMVKRLDGMGLVTHQPYRGVQLTQKGERVALEVLRHHRLLELFLAEELGLPWDRVHDEAEVLEHVLSEELEAVIAAKLGHPTHDPHGAPIPTLEGTIAASPTGTLDVAPIGSHGVFRLIPDEDPSMLRWLAEHGIRPGDTFEVVDRQPFGGPTFARFGDEVHALGGELAKRMCVEATEVRA